jgi:hypothetical protein
MGGQARFVLLLAAVGALLPLGGTVLVRGFAAGEPAALLAGLVMVLTAVAGLLVLGRIVVLLERRRTDR